MIARRPALLRFLIARTLYFDGLSTVFAMGGVYAAGAFGMNEREVLGFGVALNISAGIGAGVFSFLDDRIGSRNVILISLAGLMCALTGALVSTAETAFWISGTALGFFVGPVQASSRAYLARLAPPDARAQLFGFQAFSSKATAFLGPLLVALLTALTGSKRLGMGVISCSSPPVFGCLVPPRHRNRLPMARKPDKNRGIPGHPGAGTRFRPPAPGD